MFDLKNVYADISAADWGAITPEFSSETKREMVYVYNHYIEDMPSAQRAIRFAVGRILWYRQCLKKDYRHIVIFDDEGQAVSSEIRNEIKRQVLKYAHQCVFQTERR